MNNFIVIMDWMLKDLKLKGNELIVYALIFGFCQDGSSYKINKSYVSKFLNVRRATIFSIFKSLESKGYINIIEYKYCGEIKYKCYLNPVHTPKENSDVNGGFRQL